MKTHQKSDPKMEPKSGKIASKKRLKKNEKYGLSRGGDPCAGSRAGGFGGSLLMSKTLADTTKYYPIAAGTSRWQQIRRDTAMDQQILRRNMHERQRYLAKKIRGNKTEGRSNAKHSPATPFAPRGAVADRLYTL